MFRQRLLILVPHPDDEVVGCAGLIARARAAGAEVFTLLLTTGIPPIDRLWPWDRRRYRRRIETRLAEYERCRDVLDTVDAGRLLVPSRTLKDHLSEAHALIRETLEATRPDMLWAPAYEGGHQDHDTANFLASLFRDRADVWEFSEYSFWGGKVRSNWFPEPSRTTMSIQLNAEERERKRKLLSVYASERGNLGHILCDCEVVRPMPVHNYALPAHALPLFYQRFQWVPRHPRVDHCRPHEVTRALTDFAPPANPPRIFDQPGRFMTV
jgi:LmbE family N-acetylglucosaminyl deacetylase